MKAGFRIDDGIYAIPGLERVRISIRNVEGNRGGRPAGGSDTVVECDQDHAQSQGHGSHSVNSCTSHPTMLKGKRD